MSKSSYYYKKLAQSIIFSEKHWTEIVDPKDPYDNVYTEAFLISFYMLIMKYQKEACLEPEEIKKISILLSDLRLTYPYQSRTEKEEVIYCINEMIRLSNHITGSHIDDFYMEEYRKRYGIYAKTPFGKDMLARYWAYFIDEEPRDIKQDLSQDIYPLMLLFHGTEELTTDHLHAFLLTDCLFSTINALSCERRSILEDPIVRERFLYLLRKNKELLSSRTYESSGNENDDMIFKIQNQLVLRRLERM